MENTIRRSKRAGAVILVCMLFLLSTDSRIGGPLTKSFAEGPPQVQKETCQNTAIVADGKCGETGHGETVPCAEQPCFQYQEWTEGVPTKCEKAGEGQYGFDKCEVAEPCCYHYRAYECVNNECVQLSSQDRTIFSQQAAGEMCYVTPQ